MHTRTYASRLVIRAPEGGMDAQEDVWTAPFWVKTESTIGLEKRRQRQAQGAFPGVVGEGQSEMRAQGSCSTCVAPATALGFAVGRDTLAGGASRWVELSQ